MRNLKRVLSLALAMVMVLGVMIISSSAASKDFGDSAKIDNDYVEAIDVLTGIGILEGDEKGSFNPTTVLTREQAAKIISYLLLGTTNAEKLGNNTQIFKDVAAGRWSAGYIAYCSNLGIISGYNGNFDPEGQLTGVAFAKMLLVALGYKAENEGYTNDANWTTNVAVDAIDAGIDINGVILADPLTREQAAQMALNTLKATLVEYTTTGSTITVNGATIGIGGSAASPVTTTVAREQTISKVRLSNSNAYTIEFAEKYFPNLVLNTDTVDGMGRPAHEWSLKNSSIGVYAEQADYTAYVTTKNNTLAKVVDSISKRFNDASATIYVNGEETVIPAPDTTNAQKLGNLVEIYMDEDNTNLVDRIVVTHDTVAKVTGSVSTTTISGTTYVTVPGTSVAVANVSTVYGYNGLQKGDVVLYHTDANGDTFIQVAESFNGTMTATTEQTMSGSTTTPASYTIGGVKYNASAQTGTITQTSLVALKANTTATYWLDNAGYIIWGEGEEVPVQLMMVLKNDDYTATGVFNSGKQQSQVLFVDETGATQIVKIASVDSTKITNGNYSSLLDAVSLDVSGINSNRRNAKLFSYVLTSDGYALKSVTRTAINANIVNGLPTAFNSGYVDTTCTTNSDTIYLVRDVDTYTGVSTTNTYKDTFKVYTGYREVPSITAAHCIYYAVNGVAKYVVIDGYATIANTANDLFYAVSNDVTAVYKANGAVDYYYITGIYNGEIINLKLNATAAAAVGTNFTNSLFNITKYDASGYVDTIVKLNSTSGMYWPGMVGTKAAASDVLLLDTANGAKAFSYSANTVVYTVGTNGLLSVGSVDDIATDDNDLVTVVSKGGTLGAASNREASVIYIQKKNPTAAQFTLTLNANGHTLDYTLNGVAQSTIAYNATGTVRVAATDQIVLKPYTDSTTTYPIANVTGTNCTITKNADGTWTVTKFTGNAGVTVVWGTASAIPTVVVNAGTYTVNITSNSADAATVINTVISQLMNAGFARSEISVGYTAGATPTYTVSTTQNGVTINWTVTVF